MRVRVAAVLAVMLGLTLLPATRAQPPAIAQNEINYLLGYIEASGCEFYRNGTWYEASKAQAHLRDKYDYLANRNRINTAEDFIEKAATESSLSGRPYQVRCNDADAQTTSQWLHDVLARYRLGP
jgi:Family of unknown function (DUF5329)